MVIKNVHACVRVGLCVCVLGMYASISKILIHLKYACIEPDKYYLKKLCKESNFNYGRGELYFFFSYPMF